MASMLTTEDNPYDPRDQFLEWFTWDVAQGYNTCSYLARIVHLAKDFPETSQEFIIDQAIDEIIELHNGGLYMKLEVPAA